MTRQLARENLYDILKKTLIGVVQQWWSRHHRGREPKAEISSLNNTQEAKIVWTKSPSLIHMTTPVKQSVRSWQTFFTWARINQRQAGIFSPHHLQARFLSDTKAPGCSLRAQRSYWRVGREALLHTGVTWGEKTFWSSSTFQPNIKKLFLFLVEVRLATQRPVCVYLLSIQSLPLKHMFLKAEEELEQAFDHFQRHRLCTKTCGPPPHDKHTLAFSTCFSQTSFETCVLSLSFFFPILCQKKNILAKLSERLMKWKLIASPLFRYCGGEVWAIAPQFLIAILLPRQLVVGFSPILLYSRSCIPSFLSCLRQFVILLSRGDIQD